MIAHRITAPRQVFEGQERPAGLPRGIRKLDGRWFGDARVSFEGVNIKLIYFGLNDHVGRGAYPLESHAFHELVCTLSGSGYVTAGRRTERNADGLLTVARSGEAHASSWNAAPLDPWRAIIMQFDMEFDPVALAPERDLSLARAFAPFYDWFFLRKERSLALGPDSRAALERAVAHLAERLQTWPACGQTTVVTFFLDLVAIVSQAIQARDREAGQGLVIGLSDKERHLRRARDLLADEAYRDCSVEEVARAVGMSTFHFIREFRGAFGITPDRHRIRAAIEKAGRLLVQTDLSVGDIAVRAGFADNSSFTKAFRRHSGEAPLAFRRRGRSASPDHSSAGAAIHKTA